MLHRRPSSARAARLLAVLSAAACAVVPLAGCPDPAEGGPSDVTDAGVVVIGFDAGPLPDDPDGGPTDAGPINSVVFVTALTPPNGPLGGGNRVIFEGENFDPTCTVTIGDVEATNCLFLNTRRTSCEIPPGEQAGPQDVGMACAQGTALLEGGYTYFSPVELASVVPNTGTTEGGTEITIAGAAFSDEMLVLIGGRQVVGLSVSEDGTLAAAKTPPGLNPGRVDVTVIDAFGRDSLQLGFTYVAPLGLDDVNPTVVDPGDVVELTGRGFTELDGVTTDAAVSTNPAARQNLISDERLRVVVPTVAEGLHDVEVARGSAEAILDGALVVLPPTTGAFTLTAAVPRRVDVGGGDRVTVVGEGLLTAATVTVDGVAATDVVVQDDRRLQLTVPAHAAGAVDVVVTRTDTSALTLTAGLTYAARLGLDSVAPPAAAAVGGETVTLTGQGFVDGMVATFGGVPCASLTVESDTSATCTLAAGAAGVVDVVVRGADGQRAGLDDAFLFEAAPAVLGIRPARGAYTGDVFVTVAGAGFERLQRLTSLESRVVVFIGGVPCDPRETTIVSDNLITTRTPLTDVGVTDVMVAVASITFDDNGVPSIAIDDENQATANRVYTAFDPTSILGGTRGGPIDGAMYVTVLDASTGFPIPNALAFTGTDGFPTAADITHFPFGQATLSGPDIVGAQTVTVAADGYETSTLVDVNATEVTLYLFNIGGGGGGGVGTPPPAPPPAQVRGRVFGFAKEFFDPAVLAPDEIALAVVVTTARDEFAGTPNPGGQNIVFEEGGEYFLANTRTGRLALVALAGIFNLTTQEFRLRQMGVRREVFPVRGETQIDQDIELNIPLDRTIALSLPDAPLDFEIEDVRAQSGNGPDITRVLPFIQLGGEGAFFVTSAIDGRRNHALENMPDVPGEMMTFIAGSYSTTGRNLFTADGTASLTRNSVEVTGTGTFWAQTDFTGQPVAIGKIFVAELPDGTRFASDIVGVVDNGTIRLRDRAPINANNISYHIGDAGLPSSEVIQDGVGDLRGGVTIQPVLGIPDVISPAENGALVNRTLRWRPAPGEQPTIHLMYVYDPFAFEQLWSFYIEGSRTKVPIPVIPELANAIEALPIAERDIPEDFVPPQDLLVGGFAWQHEAIFTPGLRYDNWSNLDIGTRGRRAWTTSVRIFVHGGDD